MTTANNHIRNVRLGLLAGGLALTLWGAALFTHLQPAPDLAQHSNAAIQVAGGGGGKPNG